MAPPPLLCIVGPTAAGKTATAVQIASVYDAEIVSCDSAQVYRGMDIGTAKPSAAERAAVRHHLIDVADAEAPLNAARWAELADAAIADVRSRGGRVVVAGGTGLWLRALLHGLATTPPTDPAVRAALLARARTEGMRALHAELAARDPAAAARLSPNDRQRVLRALEHLAQAGPGAVPLSSLYAAHGGATAPARHAAVTLLLDPPRTALYARIDARVDAMMVRGFLDEVRALRARQRTAGGADAAPGALATTIGYRHLLRHLEDGLPLDEALRLLRRDTRRYAKRQLTWFRKLPGVRLAPPADPLAVAAEAWGPPAGTTA